MAGLPVPPNWAWSGETVELCTKCERPDYRSRMHVTAEGNLECDLHSIRTAGYLNEMNRMRAENESEDEEWQ